ncbi:uncharacterized protein LOC6569242 [Drosophila grimshawi]|uniref:uncharacterized protein LOC6569242 n=1 Tax=Drosophila grimshawi TaxID=7222 RepID=UPI0013EEED44|nr:uncharacterized protein LOC6569242 [Drosophila grimshawi]
MAYDFGYHPSAEEFDSLLRETRSWTRDQLANGRRRGDFFVPRYSYREPANPQSELNFQLFDTDDIAEDQQHDQQQQQPFVYELPQMEPSQQVQSNLIMIHDNPAEAAATTTAAAAANDSSLPIFFTNPATGIVYAISEVGRHTKSPGNGNDSNAIEIYVTKAQYDADLLALQQRYEQQCAPIQAQSQSVLSTPSLKRPVSSTARPQIIRLQRPKKPQVATSATSASGNNKLIHRPPPVMVVSSNASSVSDQLFKLPTIKKTPIRTRTTTTSRPKRKRKKKLKKPKTPKRQPGHKLPATTTTTVTGPQIVLGKRTTTQRPTTTTITTTDQHQLATQLEKPHMPQPTRVAVAAANGNIFNDQPFVVSHGYIELPAVHQPRRRRRRRSVEPARRLVESVGARPISSGRPRSSGRRRSTGRSSSSSSSGKRTNKRQGSTVTVPPAPGTGGSGYHAPHAVHLLHRQHNGSDEHREVGRRHSSESLGFDLIDFITGDDDDDDDGDYDDDDDNVVVKIKTALKKKKRKEQHKESSEMQSGVGQENSSSAEESADFGAMEELPMGNNITNTTGVMETQSNEVKQPTEADSLESLELQETPSSSKNSVSKKRIRRRPGGDEYYDDDEGDDDEEDMDSDADSYSDTGIGSFFRMIFYPVQVAMARIFDGFAGQSDDDVAPTTQPKYPSYTLYHSNNALADEDDDSDGDADEDDESGSLSGWLSSWFGLRRRTKRIGSTTTMPATLPTPAPQQATKEPAGWLESWFGFGKTTTTESSSEETDYDKWFAGWFDTTPKPKARRKKTTTTTTTTTTLPTPQVPILTIVDPLRNPQNWIGILAHHIVNATGNGGTSSTTSNPLLQALVTRVTSQTTTPTAATATTTTSSAHRDGMPRRISYDKYQIWRLKPQDEPQLRALEQFKKGEDGNKLQWLKGPSLRGLTDVLVPPKMLVDFQGTLDFEKITHEVLIFDVGKAIAYERNKDDYMYQRPTVTRRPTKQPVAAPTMTWNKYYDHDDILKYLETMRMRHTHLVELIHIGRSYEGRPLIVVKIESKQMAAAATAAAAASHKRLKHKRRSGRANAVFIEAGAQGMAWIGPASATWMISELLRLMRTNKTDEEHEIIRNTTWYIMPVLNPDGYAFSHEYDRFWKKSRSQHVAKAPAGLLGSAMTWLQQKRPSDKICYGVDLDRNWLYQWGKRGSSKAPCNEFYAGPSPFSEPETKAVSDFLMDYRTQIKMYISLQAYGQVVSYPVKANSTFNTERMDDFLDVAMVGSDVLRKKGSKTRYKVDSSNDLIEQRSGCSDAFAAYEIGIPFSFTLQLADNGVHGYLLPSGAIEATARDAFDIISGMLDYI